MALPNGLMTEWAIDNILFGFGQKYSLNENHVYLIFDHICLNKTKFIFTYRNDANKADEWR